VTGPDRITMVAISAPLSQCSSCWPEDTRGTPACGEICSGRKRWVRHRGAGDQDGSVRRMRNCLRFSQHTVNPGYVKSAGDSCPSAHPVQQCLGIRRNPDQEVLQHARSAGEGHENEATELASIVNTRD
jgi:hypothetical protein